jgi:hypothetical protein
MDELDEMNDKRYEEILRRIEAQKHAKEKPDVTLTAILDSVNAMDMIAQAAARDGWVCWGPKAFTGKGWLGALVWGRRATYHGYRVLTVVGVWVVMRKGGVDTIFGVKRLPYSVPFYEPEAYHTLMHDTFVTYYGDDGSPPTEPLYTTPYTAEKRLAIRASLKNAIATWIEQEP